MLFDTLKMSKKFILLLLLLMALSSMGQDVKKTVEFTTFLKNDKIEFSGVWMDCEQPQDGVYAEYVILRLKNLTSETLTVSWYNDIFMDETCTNCDHSIPDRKRTVTLQPGQQTVRQRQHGPDLALAH